MGALSFRPRLLVHSSRASLGDPQGRVLEETCALAAWPREVRRQSQSPGSFRLLNLNLRYGGSLGCYDQQQFLFVWEMPQQ